MVIAVFIDTAKRYPLKNHTIIDTEERQVHRQTAFCWAVVLRGLLAAGFG